MKKYFKKIGALLIAVMMLVAMAVPVSAAEIKIANAGSATKQYLQVIEPDTTSATGWKFVGATAENDFAKIFTEALDVDDEQEAIVMLIKKAAKDANATVDVPSKYNNAVAATEAQFEKALSNLDFTNAEMMGDTLSVNGAGLYAIRAFEEGYTYQDMAVYVDFEGVSSPETLQAKKETTEINKAIDVETPEGKEAGDQAVAIGDQVDYVVSSKFPYIPANSTDKQYVIEDTLTGAAYKEGTVKVTLGGEDITKSENIKIDIDTQNNVLTVDLSSFIDDANSNATKDVVVTYSAIVTATAVNNKVSHSADDHKKHAETNVYTGEITLTKTDEDDKPLPDAAFKVLDKNNNEYKFVKTGDGEYTLAVGESESAVIASELVTNGNGQIIVKGLDEGTYHFEEVEAPDGYSINENGIDIELTADKVKENGVATKIFTAEDSLTDTKLSALPSTGSVGTYLFTIIGVGIMAVMVCLFTIKRRRDA
ncbi:MAG: SpaA isopeptide-forming pilin-related protein [Lachnospiraceae bacterium]|nr:SpaA isopeptide-forming pilin-related protein [Lachnospiraceae bacterium]